MKFWNYITQDTVHNQGNTKGKIIIVLFRLAAYLNKNKILKIIGLPYLVFYNLITHFVFSIELPYRTKIGKGLKIYHGMAIVVHQNTIIGTNCTIRQCTTIGNAKTNGKCPIIGNNVEIGCNVCIIGDLHISDNVIIGAGSVIVKNIPANTLAVGNPSRLVKYNTPSIDLQLQNVS